MSVTVSISGNTSPTITATTGDTIDVTVSAAGATGPQGVQGATGPANTLSIGTVTSGASAAATITGTAPSQTLSLVLPVGATGAAGSVGATGSQGPAGPANTLSIGTVTSGAAAATITGTAPTQTLNLVLPAGATGATGATGAQGPAGPANTLSIGTVNSGSSPSVTITGTAPNQTLNLVLARGDTGAAGATGATGPANTLSIGSVTEGSSAGASITGTAPNQTLNLTIPATTLSIGTVTSGSSPAVTITGTAPAQVLNFTLAKGDKGDTGSKGDTGAAGATGAAGPANSLSIGTISSGTSAAATITGTAPSQTLNLTLPKGDKGDTGSQGPAGESYTLPTASSSVLGGVKVGSGLAIASGVLSATGGGGSANIVEATTSAGFPATGASQTLYHATDVRRIYFWDASGVYVEAGPSGGGGSGLSWSSVPASPTASGTAGNIAYDNSNGFFYVATAANAWKRAALSTWATPDPYFSSVSLLMHFDGANGSTTLTDSSSNAFSVTRNGSAQISTAESRFGGSSLLLNGTSDSIVLPAASAFNFGSDNFTIELWVRFASLSAAQRIGGGDLQGGGTYNWAIYKGSGSSSLVFLIGDGSSPWNMGSTGFGTVTVNQWHHVAIVRNGNTFTGYIDGVAGGNFSSSGSLVANSTNGAFFGFATGDFFNGYMDEIRITKGANGARYTANFTPPTAAFPSS
jgi:hypothetical protein